jgi:alkaline phosphatase
MALWTARGAHVLGLFQAANLETELPEPTLAELTRKAMQLLTAPAPRTPAGKSRGFFLMVEGSLIDSAGHKNDAENTIRQTLLFDEAVRMATDFARQDRHTLVIVTADHETGGLVIASDKRGAVPQAYWTSKQHSAMPVPLYAFGPGAQRFAGTLDNTDIPKRIAELLKIADFPRVLETKATKENKAPVTASATAQ